jgi:AraC-like DNA-binding protein
LSHQAHITLHQLDSLLQEAARAGVQVDDVLKSIGYDNLLAENSSDETKLSLFDFFRIEGEIARRLDDLTAHLSERRLTYDTGAFVTTQVNRSTTLSDAISDLARHFNMMHGEHYNTVRVTERTVTLIINDSSFPYTMKNDLEMVHFVGECVLIQVFCLLDSLSGGLADHALKRVSVKRPMLDPMPGHLLFWNSQMMFGQAAYELTFDYELSLAPMTKTGEVDLSSEGVFSRVIDYLEKRTPRLEPHSFKGRTMDSIRSGVLRQEVVAEKLSISVATLRRRLSDEQTSFRELVNHHRMREAMDLLAKGHSVSHVSDLLNYSDIRAFNRAFKRWKGETPAQYSRRSRVSHIPA